jgi:hypothetical protein
VPLSCKLTSNFNTAVTVISTRGPSILNWNSSLSAFHQLKRMIHTNSTSPFVWTKWYRSVSGFDLNNTTMHYIGCMYVGNKPAACTQPTLSRWIHFRHYVLITLKWDAFHVCHLRANQTVIGNIQLLVHWCCQGFGGEYRGVAMSEPWWVKILLPGSRHSLLLILKYLGIPN